MKHNLEIVNCAYIHYNNFEMINAKIVDNTDHKNYDVSEWVVKHDHVSRKNSCIEENDLVPKEILTDVLNILDKAIADLNHHVLTNKSKALLPKVYKIIFSYRKFL